MIIYTKNSLRYSLKFGSNLLRFLHPNEFHSFRTMSFHFQETNYLKSDSQKQKAQTNSASFCILCSETSPKYSSKGKSTVSKTVQIPSSNSELSHKRRKSVIDDVSEEVAQLGSKDRTRNNEVGTFDLEFSQIQPNLPSNDGNPAKTKT